MATYISTTPRGPLDAQKYQGILVSESYAQIRSALTRSLSERHARFFAEPFFDNSGQTIDWYTDAPGKVVPLVSLNPVEQQAARNGIQALALDIQREAVALKDSPEQSKSIRGHILELALRYPGTEFIHMAGDQPVLTGWGFLPGPAQAQPEDLIRLGAAAALPVEQTPEFAAKPEPNQTSIQDESTASVGERDWLRPILLILAGLLGMLALYLLLGMLLHSSGSAGPGGSGCSASLPVITGCSADTKSAQPPTGDPAPQVPSADQQDALTRERERSLSLQRRIDDVHMQLAERAGQCAKTPPPKAEIPAEQPPMLADLLPTTPETPVDTVLEPQPAPPVESPIKPAAPKKPTSGEDMRIPRDAARNNDLSFLEGCWNSETGLVSGTTKEPIVVQYCFDANGTGTRIINTQDSKDRCTGPLRAKFHDSGVLLIEADGATCKRGGGFYPHSVRCKQQDDGRAECSGQEKGGERNTWEARFRRS